MNHRSYLAFARIRHCLFETPALNIRIPMIETRVKACTHDSLPIAGWRTHKFAWQTERHLEKGILHNGRREGPCEPFRLWCLTLSRYASIAEILEGRDYTTFVVLVRLIVFHCKGVLSCVAPSTSHLSGIGSMLLWGYLCSAPVSGCFMTTLFAFCEGSSMYQTGKTRPRFPSLPISSPRGVEYSNG